MIRGPVEEFGKELDALIEKWQNRPLDDRLVFSEVVGVLECKKFDLIRESQERRSWETD